MTKTETPPVNFLGGNTYGDGTYVVEFINTRSAWAPLKALVLSPATDIVEMTFATGTEPNVQTARRVIAIVRAEDTRGV